MSYYVGLVSGWKPDGTPIELYARGYCRQPIVEPMAKVVWPTCTTDWGQIVGIVLYDADEVPVWRQEGLGYGRQSCYVMSGDTISLNLDLRALFP